jgi:CRP-like cAMP-binding protein
MEKFLAQALTPALPSIFGIHTIESKDDSHISFLIQLLKKPFAKRSKRERQLILEFFTQVRLFQEFMKELNEAALQSLSNEVSYHFARAGTTIFNVGEKGRTWYHILKGNVYVLVPSHHHGKEKKERLHLAVSTGEELSLEDLNLVNELSSGDSFGDVALRRNTTRTATIIAKSDTHFATLSAEVYQRIIGRHIAKELLRCSRATSTNDLQ